MQKGIRERLLCDDCETTINKYERYVSQLISNQQDLTIIEKKDHFEITGIEYNLFKLFVISLFWRFHEASHSKFRKVSLGPHADSFRDVLLSGKAPDEDTYPVALGIFDAEDFDPRSLMIGPDWIRIDSTRAYRAPISSYIWLCAVSSHTAPKLFRDFSIKESGLMRVTGRPIEKIPFIFETLLRHVQSNTD